MKYIGKINGEIIGEYKESLITEEVILTDERLNNHILTKHKDDYEELKDYLKEIVENPDIILEDNKKENTLILLKIVSSLAKRTRSY